jgi:hypothetical protein
MNDAFRGWAETHHEIVTIINYQIDRDVNIFGQMPRLLDEIMSTEGTGGIYDLCFELTNEFEKTHEGRQWDGSHDWFDAVIEFVQEKIS